MKKLAKWSAVGMLVPALVWGNWAEVTKFVEGNGDGNLSAGYSMDVDNNYLVVGAPDENGSYGVHDGAVYVFTKDSETEAWTPFDKIEGYFNESLGTDVAVKDMGGNNVFVVAGGPDYEFYNGKTRTTEYKDIIDVYALSSSGHFRYMQTFYDTNGSGLGTSVDLASFIETSGIPPNVTTEDKGILVVAGEPFSSTADGRVITYAFSLMDGNSSNWKSFTVSDPGLVYNHYGHAVAVTDDKNYFIIINGRAHLAVGAPQEDVQTADDSTTYTDKGAVYVYELDGTFSDGFSWSKEARLTQDVNGLIRLGNEYAHNSRFGTSVDLTDWNLVVGALIENTVPSNSLGTYLGEADIFSLHDVDTNSWDFNTTFVQPQNPKLIGSELYGYSVAIDENNIVAVGAPNYDGTGAVFVFGYDANTSTWKEMGMVIGQGEGALGTSVDILSNGNVIAGDPKNDTIGVYEWKQMEVNPALLMYLLN